LKAKWIEKKSELTKFAIRICGAQIHLAKYRKDPKQQPKRPSFESDADGKKSKLTKFVMRIRGAQMRLIQQRISEKSALLYTIHVSNDIQHIYIFDRHQ